MAIKFLFDKNSIFSIFSINFDVNNSSFIKTDSFLGKVEQLSLWLGLQSLLTQIIWINTADNPGQILNASTF